MRAEQQAAVHVDREVLDLAGQEVGLGGYLPEPCAGRMSCGGAEGEQTDGRKRPRESHGHRWLTREAAPGGSGTCH